MKSLAFAALALLLLAGPVWAEDGLEAQLAQLAHKDPLQRLRATNALGACGRRPACAKAARALERALFDPVGAVRRGALNALVALDARGAAGAVVRLIQVERDASVLPAALLALGRLRVQGQSDILVRHAAHPTIGVRAAALAAAGDLGGARLRRLVLNSLQLAGAEDEQWIVRSSAILALAKIGQAEDLGLIQRAFAQGGGKAFWMARAAVAKAIAALNPKPRAALERLLLDVDSRVAVTAATGLATTGHGAVLVTYLRDGRSAVRAAAVGGVRQGNVRTATARLRHMARFDGSREVRFAAAIALFVWRDPTADEMLLDALRSNDPAIWGAAAARLARRTGQQHGRKVKAWRHALAAERTAHAQAEGAK